MAKQTFYGLRGHLRIAWPGVIAAFDLAPAPVRDIRMAPEFNQEAHGWELGDPGYWSPQLTEKLRKAEVELIAPHKKGRSPHWSVMLTRSAGASRRSSDSSASASTPRRWGRGIGGI